MNDKMTSCDYNNCAAKDKIEDLKKGKTVLHKIIIKNEEDMRQELKKDSDLIHKMIDEIKAQIKDDKTIIMEAIVKLGTKIEESTSKMHSMVTKILMWLIISAVGIIGSLVVYIWNIKIP